MELRILGCSGGEAEGERLTSLLVDRSVAIDAGSLTDALSIGEQIQIRHVFLSHSHLDHICTLPFYAKNVFGHLDEPIQVHALPETLDAIKKHLFNDEIWPDFSVIPTPTGKPILQYVEVEPEKTYEIDGLRFTPIAVNHLVSTVGYKIEDDHSAFLFTADTASTDRIYQVANKTKNLKFFITEVSFPNAQAMLADASKHLTPAMLKQELKKLKMDVPVGLYHLTPGDKEALLPEIAAIGDKRAFVMNQDSVFRW